MTAGHIRKLLTHSGPNPRAGFFSRLAKQRLPAVERSRDRDAGHRRPRCEALNTSCMRVPGCCSCRCSVSADVAVFSCVWQFKVVTVDAELQWSFYLHLCWICWQLGSFRMFVVRLLHTCVMSSFVLLDASDGCCDIELPAVSCLLWYCPLVCNLSMWFLLLLSHSYIFSFLFFHSLSLCAFANVFM